MKNTSLKTLSEALANGSFSLGSVQANLLKRKLVNDYFTDLTSIEDTLEDRVIDSEKKLMSVIMESGVQSAKAWFHTKELATLCNKLGAKYLKLDKYDRSEKYILRAKQLTEPLSNSPKWVEKLDWQLLRISILQNLSSLFKKTGKFKKMYDTLTQCSKELGPSRITDDPVLIMSGIESLYLNWADASLNLKKIEETLTHCNIALKIINLFLSNPLFTREMKYLLNNNKNDLDFIVSRKYLMKALASYLTGKCLKKCSQLTLAVQYMEEASTITRQYIGPNEDITIKYQRKYENWKRESDFYNQMKDDDIEFKVSDIELIDSDSKLNSAERKPGPKTVGFTSNSHTFNVNQRPKSAVPTEGLKSNIRKSQPQLQPQVPIASTVAENIQHNFKNLNLKTIVNNVPKGVSLVNSYFNQQDEGEENSVAQKLMKERLEIEKLLQPKENVVHRKSTDEKGKAFSIKKHTKGKSTANYLYIPSSSSAQEFVDQSTTYKKTSTQIGGASYEIVSPLKTMEFKTFIRNLNGKNLVKSLLTPNSSVKGVHYKGFRTKSNPAILQGIHKESILSLNKESHQGSLMHTVEKRVMEDEGGNKVEPQEKRYDTLMNRRPVIFQSFNLSSKDDNIKKSIESNQKQESFKKNSMEEMSQELAKTVGDEKIPSIHIKKRSSLLTNENVNKNRKLVRGETDFIVKHSPQKSKNLSRKSLHPDSQFMLTVPGSISGYISRRNSKDNTPEYVPGGGNQVFPAQNAIMNSSFNNMSSYKSQNQGSSASPRKKSGNHEEAQSIGKFDPRHHASRQVSNIHYSHINNENDQLDSQIWGNLAIARAESKKKTSNSQDKKLEEDPSLSASFSDLSDMVISPTAKAKKKLNQLQIRSSLSGTGILFPEKVENDRSFIIKEFKDPAPEELDLNLVRSSSKNNSKILFTRKPHGMKTKKKFKHSNKGPNRKKYQLSLDDAAIIIQRAFLSYYKKKAKKKIKNSSRPDLLTAGSFAMRRASNYMSDLIAKRKESVSFVSGIDAHDTPINWKGLFASKTKYFNLLSKEDIVPSFKFFYTHPEEFNFVWNLMGLVERTRPVKNNNKAFSKNMNNNILILVLSSPTGIPVFYHLTPSIKNTPKTNDSIWKWLSHLIEEWINDHRFSEWRKTAKENKRQKEPQIIFNGAQYKNLLSDPKLLDEISTFLNLLVFVLDKCTYKIKTPQGWIYKVMLMKELITKHTIHYENNNSLLKSILKDRKSIIYHNIVHQEGISSSIKVKLGAGVTIINKDPTEDFRTAFNQFGSIPGQQQSDKTKKSILKRTKSDKTTLKNFVIRQPEAQVSIEKKTKIEDKFNSFDGKARLSTNQEIESPSLRPSSKDEITPDHNKEIDEELKKIRESDPIPVIDIKTPKSSSYGFKNNRQASFYHDIGQSWGMIPEDKLSEQPSFNNLAEPKVDLLDMNSFNNLSQIQNLNPGSNIIPSSSNIKMGSATSISGKATKTNSNVGPHQINSGAIEEELKEANEDPSPNSRSQSSPKNIIEDDLQIKLVDSSPKKAENPKKWKTLHSKQQGLSPKKSTDKRSTLTIPRLDLNVNYSLNLPRATTENNLIEQLTAFPELEADNTRIKSQAMINNNTIIQAVNIFQQQKHEELQTPDIENINFFKQGEFRESDSPAKLETSMQSGSIISERAMKSWKRKKSRENLFASVTMVKNNNLVPLSYRKREYPKWMFKLNYFDPMPWKNSPIVPETTVNPFMAHELLTIGILRKENTFLLTTVYLDNKEPNEINFLPDNMNILINVFDLRLSSTADFGWSEEICLDFSLFVKEFLLGDFNIKKFIYRKGLSKSEQISAITQAQRKLKVKKGRLVLSSETLSRRNPLSLTPSPLLSYLYYLDIINHLDIITKINDGMGNDYCRKVFKKYRLILKKFSFLNPKIKIKKQNFIKEEKLLLILGKKKFEKMFSKQFSIYTPANIQSNEKLKEKFTAVLHGSEKANIEVFKFYNSIKRIGNVNEKHYYTSKSNLLGAKYFRITFHEDQNGLEYARISLYEPLQKQTRYCIVSHPCDLEKLINIMQLESNEMREKALSLLLQLQIVKVGKILEFKENRHGVREIRRSLISRESLSGIKITLLSRGYDDFLRTYYYRNSSYEMFSIENIGTCLVKITVVSAKPSYVQGTQAYFYFEITPFSSRTKLHKFIMSLADIRKYFNRDIPLDNRRSMLIHLNTYILNKIVYYRDLIYSKFKIPFSNLSYNKELYKYELKPEILKLQYEKPNPELFLAPKYYSERVIFQGFKKISNQEYVLITIKKNLGLGYWAISLYSPKSCRNFISYMYEYDILKINATFYDSAFPLSIDEIKSKIGSNVRKLKYADFDQLLDEKKNERETAKSVMLSNANSLRNLHNYLDYKNNMNRFLEIKFWETIVKKFDFQSTNNHKKVLSVDSFRGVLREYLYIDVLSYDESRDVLFELFLEKKNYLEEEVSSPIECINYRSTLEYYIYIRLNDISKYHISNDKFILRELVHSYTNDGFFERKGHIMWDLRDIAFNQSDLKKLGHYVYQKIKNNETILIFPHIESPSSERKSFIQKDKLIRTEEEYIEIRQIKLNITMEHDRRFESTTGKYILMFRNVFTIRPLQMIAVLFNKRRNKFLVYLYNNKNSLRFIKRYSLAQLEEFIPYVENLIKLNLNKEIGMRILKKLKNSLIISSIYNMK